MACRAPAGAPALAVLLPELVRHVTVKLADTDAQVSCEHPFSVTESASDHVRLKIFGDPRLEGRVRVHLPGDGGQKGQWRDQWVTAGQELYLSLELLPASAG